MTKTQATKLTSDQRHYLCLEQMTTDIEAILDQYLWHRGDKKIIAFANEAKKAVRKLGIRAEKLAKVEIEE